MIKSCLQRASVVSHSLTRRNIASQNGSSFVRLRQSLSKSCQVDPGRSGVGGGAKFWAVMHTLRNQTVVCQNISTAVRRYASAASSRSSSSHDHQTDEEKEACPKCNKEVDFEELRVLLRAGDVQLVDVREPKEVAEYGMIEQAVNLPLTQLKAALSAAEEDEFLTKYGFPKPTKQISNLVFYGHKSVKSSAALEIAHKLGYKTAKHYPGGYDEWKQRDTTK